MLKFYRTTIGKKAVMAVSGLSLVLFTFVHMVGNLKVFQGRDPMSGRPKMDVYSEFLRTVGSPMFSRGELLWVARLGLLALAVFHIYSALAVTRANRRARPIGYEQQKFETTTLAARTMWWGGLILAAFIIYHILHMTTGHLHFEGFQHGRVQQNVVAAFHVWYVVLIYLLAMGALCSHIYHGLWSALQTLSLNIPKYNKVLRNISKMVALVIFLGFISVPLGVFFGLVH